MNSTNASHVHSPRPGLASWYTPGRTDAFGDRLLMFDNTDTVSLELLRFRRELATAAGFENALRDRVEQLASFRHPSFPIVRAVVHLDDLDLTLVSTHIPGQRLSELPAKLRKGLHPAVVTWIVREVTTALAALQAVGPGVAHGALSGDRIIVTSDGRLCIVEYTLGAAIRRLELSPVVFWRQFGLLAPIDRRGLVRIDQQTDIVQLGMIALSLLLGRALSLHDLERGLPALLDEFSDMAALSPSVFAAPLRAWLERALQLAARPYRSAHDAMDGLHELPVANGPAAAIAGAAFQPAGTQATPTTSDPRQAQADVLPVPLFSAAKPLQPRVLPTVAPTRSAPARVTNAGIEPAHAANGRGWMRSYGVWIATTLAVIALAEGAIIARLGTLRGLGPVAAPVADVAASAADVAPPAAPLARTQSAMRKPAVESAALTTSRSSKDAPAAALAQAASRQRPGGIRWSSPIDLNVFEGDRVLGSTADGPIVTTAGTHQLDLVNAALGYRVHQTVTVRAGVITPLAITIPMGRININAEPPAQVLIDGSPIGETPLANVSASLGQHTIVFRHPQMGERRETVTVRADVVTDVSTAFDR